ncbi:TniQ family protein [Sulfuriferula nivalis]|uniref:TniQ domain-containing protein n=1 Tax=Sulfuriferula nivalis TaxID=2675298 RepID=A0A809REM0_9PROT|nr:TniQ family protein [Sulfuriferula nivalis]BBO99313.1 hypothetical protein SFSGTM_00220 [Sulfuriferula nivalis]
MSPLLIRPEPENNEGPRGYLLRLAEANYLQMIDLEKLGVLFTLDSLQSNGLMPNSALDPVLYDYLTRLTDLWNQKPRIWNSQAARFCPHCLKNEPVWQVGWELYFYDACPEHGVWLIDRCSSCGQNIKWGRGALLRCQCGADLRQEVPVASSSSGTALVKVLQNILHDRPDEGALIPLQKLDITQMQQLTRYIGAGLRPGMGMRALKIRHAGTMAISWTITSHAAEVFANWPAAFHELLNQFERQESSRSLKFVIGQAYRYLYTVLSAPQFDPVRFAFEEWLLSSWKGGVARRNRRLVETIMHRAEWIPAKLACSELGISMKRIQFLVQSGMLEGQTTVYQSGRRFLTVKKTGLDQVASFLKTGINLKTAAKLLGFSKKRIRGILLLLFPNASRSGGVSTPWFVPLADIDAVLSIRENLPVVALPDEGCVSINHLLRYFIWTESEMVALIKETQQGNIKAVGVQADLVGVNGVLYREAEIRVWRDRHKQGQGSWLTLAQVAEILMIHKEAASDFIHLGFLQSVMLPRILPGGGHRISRVDLEHFQKEYVTSTEIARRVEQPARKIRVALAGNGIAPISGSKVDFGRQTLYIRSAVEAFLDSSDFLDDNVGKSNLMGNLQALSPNDDSKPLDF